MPTTAATVSQSACLASLRPSFAAFQVSRSSRMRWLRSPSVSHSIHMKSLVHTVCGQAYPHQRRPATVVKRKSENAAMMSNHDRKMKSCGQKVTPNRWKCREGTSNQIAWRSSHVSHGATRNTPASTNKAMARRR